MTSLRLFVAVVAASAALTLPACKTEREASGEAAKSSVSSFQKELAAMPGQIDRTTNALVSLTGGGGVDRSKGLAEFSKQLATLKEEGMSLAEARDSAQKDTQRYFRAWLKESRSIKNDQERQEAYAALDKGRARTDLATRYLNDGSRDFRSLTDRLDQIQASLTKDMSDANIQTVRNDFTPVLEKALSLKGNIAQLDKQITTALTGQ
jgi:hypothetical protein